MAKLTNENKKTKRKNREENKMKKSEKQMIAILIVIAIIIVGVLAAVRLRKDDETTGKMTTQAFVDLLNGEREEESWKMGKEYPILSWQ